MTKETAKTAEVAEKQTKPMERKSRIPVSGPRDILTISNMDPNYKYRWVKDVPGRVQRFLDGGYEFVNHDAQVGQRAVDSGSRLGSALTRNDGGNVLVAMRIPLQWYNEDQEAKQAQIDALEDSMRAEGGRQDGLDGGRPDSGRFHMIKPGGKR
jgi:hypothetical protein